MLDMFKEIGFKGTMICLLQGLGISVAFYGFMILIGACFG